MNTTAGISHLHTVDWLIIAIYFAFVLGIGAYVRRQTRTGNDFFMAGRRNSAWVAGLAFLSANMGALELLGMAGQSYEYGMLTAHFYFIGAIPAMLFLGIFMMPFYYSSRIHSIPRYLELRFDGRTRTLNAVAFALMTVLMSGINLYAMALVLHIFVGWDFNISIWISSITIGIYITLGGLISAIFSEVMQFFLIWFGLLLVVILGLIDVGGWSGIVSRIPETYIHLWANTGTTDSNPMLINWIGIAMGLGFVLSFGYWTTDFLVVQRGLSAKDMRSAQMTPILASFFKMLLPVLVIGAGLIFLALQHMGKVVAPQHPDDALLLLIDRYYSPGLLGLGVTALLASFMSGQAGNVSAFNTVFTYDIYKAKIKTDASDAHYVWVGRVMTLVGVLLSVLTAYWAMAMTSIMDYMQALFSIVNAPLFATIALGMFWRRTTATGAFWGLLIGMTSSAAMFLLTRFNILPVQYLAFSPHASEMAGNFWRALWCWLITFSVTIIISKMTTAPATASLEGLVYGGGR